MKRSRRRDRSLQIVCNQFVFQVLTKYPVEDIWEDEYLKLEYGCSYEVMKKIRKVVVPLVY